MGVSDALSMPLSVCQSCVLAWQAGDVREVGSQNGIEAKARCMDGSMIGRRWRVHVWAHEKRLQLHGGT